MPLFPVSAIPSASVDYEIDNSLRFNDDDSAYLSASMSGAGGRTTFTYSGWVKLGNTGVAFDLLAAPYSSSANGAYLRIESSGYFYSQTRNYSTGSQGAFDGDCTSAMIFRDPTAWYHIVFAYDSTLATAVDRQKLYVNGDLQTFSAQDTVTQNNTQYLGSEYTSLIGRNYGTTGNIDGYLAEVNFIDGQALTPSSFGKFGAYGEWNPIEYTGTYGTNGFHLDFKTSGTLGNDANGSNNWTTNNLSATDQMIDTPTNNFATLNPLFTNGGVTQSMSEGNLKFLGDGNYATAAGTIGLRTGKWYWETVNTVSAYQVHGIVRGTASAGNTFVAYDPNGNVFGFGYSQNDDIYGSAGTGSTTAAVLHSTGTTYTVGDVIGFASDIQNGTLAFYKNNVLVYTITGINDDDWIPALSRYSGGKSVVNFGQDSSFAGNKTAQGNQDGNAIGDFYYTPPTGFLALCTKNLPAPTVIPSEHFNTVTYTGDGAVSNAITGVGFQPEFTWIKGRSGATSHGLYDSVRGVQKDLASDTTAAETTQSTGLTSFDSDGFTTEALAKLNTNLATYVAWNWKAGGAGTSVAESGTGDGSINAHTHSANTSAGFSIVKYEGRGDEISGGSHTKVGHGLSVAPEMVIIKSRDNVRGWAVMADPLTYANVHLRLDTTAAKSAALYVGSSAPDSTHFYVGDDGIVNAVSENYIAYCFHSVDGYSKVGSYTGNGSADGTFVHTGFRPAYVMLKSTASAEWILVDNARNPTNEVDNILTADDSSSEAAFGTANRNLDFLSNGFKIRETAAGGTTAMNASSATYIYLAFAESPFKHSNAR